MSKTKLCATGHIATTHDLIAMGASRGQLSRAVADARLLRLRQGVYACPHVNETLATAARLGGAVTCVSVLRESGVWAGTSRKLHLQVPPNASDRGGAGVHLHWEVPQFAMTTKWRASRMQAMWQAIRCLDEEHAIAALESAIHQRFLTPDEVATICANAPGRLRDGISRMVTDSGSGLETIVRLRLQRAGFDVTSQANIPGLGHQDLLVFDCVAIEIDGFEWHGREQFETDRERDLHAARLGRRTIRLTSRQVLDTWADSASAIERAVADSQSVRYRGVR
jgi:very-short-patch-repair endonuclease